MKKVCKYTIISYGVIFCVLYLISCKKSDDRYVLDGLAQGTYYHIVFYANDTIGVKQDIKHIFNEIDNSLSLWNQNSIINKVNRNEEVELDSIFITNFRASQYFAELTDGSFDITVGELVRKYGFAEKDRENLTQRQLDSLLKYVGYNKISLNKNRLVKNFEQTKLDFNAIAQGYTSDRIATYFKNRNIKSFIIDVGGEVVCGEIKPNQQKWAVGIEKPIVSDKEAKTNNHSNKRRTQEIIYLQNASVVTSGNYRKFYIENGLKYSHTIDPKTGKPVTHSLLSASVIANNATTADALATSFMVMGLENTKKFLQKHKQYDAMLIYSNEIGEIQIWESENFSKYKK